MALDAVLGIKYKLQSSEKFDEYMKAVGVSMMVRKVAGTLSPVVELTKSGDEYTLTSTTSFKANTFKFKEGVEFDQETADGRKVKSTIKIDGCTLHEVQTDASGKSSTIDRTFSPDGISMVLKADNIVSTRHYKPQ